MLKDKYKELLKEQKEEREKLKKEMEIQSFISVKTTIPFKVYISDLYGVKAWVTFKGIFGGGGLDKRELNILLEEFPAINMFLCGDNSFRPLADKKEESIKINPYIIKYGGFDGSVLIEWFSKVKGYVIQVKAKISNELINEFLSVDYERKEFKGGFRIENIRCHINGNFADGEYKYIRWGRGTEKYPNDFTIYTENTQTDFKEYLNT